MKYNLKKVFYLDGIIEEYNIAALSSTEKLANLIEAESAFIKRELANEIERHEKPTDSYIPEKLRREECYVRFEIYPAQ